MMKTKGILIVVSGFSGAGKGTLMNKLVQSYDNYALSISMTTRNPRYGEVAGKDYFFISKEEFEGNIANDELIEYAGYVGNYYGTPKTYVEQKLEEGMDVILEIEIQGALKVKEKFPEALLLFVMPPSVKELKRRLIERGSETIEVIQKRLLRAVEEAQGIDNYEYIIINDDLEQCISDMHHIIQSSKYKADRNKEFIDNIRNELNDLSKGEN